MTKKLLEKAVVAVLAGLAHQAWGEGLIITGSTAPLRGSNLNYTAQTDPPGLPLGPVSWQYAMIGATRSYTDANADADDKSSWSGRMVVGGTLSCTALVNGVQCSTQAVIAITARSWSVPLSCVEDNEPGWGEVPTVAALLGDSRDRDSNTADIFIPRVGSNWDSAYTLGQVSSGPCQGLWFVSSSSLKAQRETVINRYIKSDGPSLGGLTFAEANAPCLLPSVADFLQAVKNHEYRGTPPVQKSVYGHFGRLEKAIRDLNHDPKMKIEALVNPDSSELRDLVNAAIAADEIAVREYYRSEWDQAQTGPNWGQGAGALGSGYNARWVESSSTWTSCVNGPDNF